MLLADEPTGNLDRRTGIEIVELFHSLHADGATVVVITHESDVAARAGRVIRLRDGSVIEDVRAAAGQVVGVGGVSGVGGAA